MAEPVKPSMTPIPQSHDRHDHYLVAALAADDLEPLARSDAERLVGSCAACAELLADLRSIALATHALPAVPRRRDFRITERDAARLRPSGWRSVLAAFGGARGTFTRPLAVGLTTLGLAGILAASIPGALSGFTAGAAPAGPEVAAAPSSAQGDGFSSADGAGKAGAAASEPLPAATAALAATPAAASIDLHTSSGPAPSAAASAAAATVAPSEAAIAPGAASPSLRAVNGGGPGVVDVGQTGSTTGSQVAPPDASRAFALGDRGGVSGQALLLIVSIVCLAVGLGLFLLRWAARRSASF